MIKLPADKSELVAQFEKRHFLTERDAFGDFLNIFIEITESDVGYIHLINDDEDEIRLTVWSNNTFAVCTTVNETHYPLAKAGIWADSVRLRQPVVHNDYQHMPINQKNELPEGHFPVIRHASFPIEIDGKVCAILGLGNRKAPYSDTKVDDTYQNVAQYWSILEKKLSDIKERKIGLMMKYESINPKDTLLALVSAMSSALELRDEYTSHHQQNVSFLSKKIAIAMDLLPYEVEAIAVGALVHDIGKIGVPSEILNKLRPLTNAELALVKTHSQCGADIFKNIHLPFPLLEMIEQHHERLDGSGYPKGLSGKDIILEARIIAVADTFDAMASDRPYRHCPGRQAAIAELKQFRNIKYDVYVVDTFLHLLETDPDLAPGAMYA